MIDTTPTVEPGARPMSSYLSTFVSTMQSLKATFYNERSAIAAAGGRRRQRPRKSAKASLAKANPKKKGSKGRARSPHQKTARRLLIGGDHRG